MRSKTIKKLLIAVGMAFLSVISVNLINESKYILVGTLDMPNPSNIELISKWNEQNYTDSLNNAIDAWNNSEANVEFLVVNEPTDKIYVDITDYSFGNIGWHAKTYSYSIVDSSPNIQINNSYYPFKGNGDELIAHELGHILRLADVKNTKVLMRSTGYKGSANPEKQDVEEVKLVYKNKSNAKLIYKYKSNAKLEYSTEDVNELITDSESVIVGNVSNIEKMKIGNTEFQIVDFNVDKCIKGNIEDNLSVKIVQTCDIIQEPLLKKNEKYLLFADKYNGSIVDNAYVAKGLHHGIYKLENKNIQAVSDLNNTLKNDIEGYLIDDLCNLINNLKK